MDVIRSFRVNADLLQKIKVLCARRKITIVEFVRKALAKYYEEVRKE